jgi:hypothetical protein
MAAMIRLTKLGWIRFRRGVFPMIRDRVKPHCEANPTDANFACWHACRSSCNRFLKPSGSRMPTANNNETQRSKVL